MITNQDRSKWFGASDTATIMGNWETETFKQWWLVKLGLYRNTYKTWAMDCGNIMEIPIIRAIEEQEKRKIWLGKIPLYNPILRLRCNYDGLTKEEVIEIKTMGKSFAKVPKHYWQQCQVLMYKARKKKTGLYAYLMTESDYLNPYFPDIDYKRLKRHEILYDEQFITKEYLPRLKYLAKCLKQRRFPVVSEYEQRHY